MPQASQVAWRQGRFSAEPCQRDEEGPAKGPALQLFRDPQVFGVTVVPACGHDDWSRHVFGSLGPIEACSAAGSGNPAQWRRGRSTSIHLPPHHPKGKAHQEIERDSAVRKLQGGLDTGLNHCQNEKEKQPENEPVNAIVRFDSPPDGVDETSCY